MAMNRKEEENKESARYEERKKVISKWGQTLTKSELRILMEYSKETLNRRLKKLLPQLEDYGYSKYDKYVSAVIIDKFFRAGYCNRNKPDNP